MKHFASLLITVSLALFLAGCAAHSHMLVGTRRPPISAEQVRIYTTPPAKFEQIAVIDSDSSQSWAMSTQGRMDAATKGLKIEAAALGANGVLLQSVGNQAGRTYGYGNAASGWGSWWGAVDYDKRAQGTAIYVPGQ